MRVSWHNLHLYLYLYPLLSLSLSLSLSSLSPSTLSLSLPRESSPLYSSLCSLHLSLSSLSLSLSPLALSLSLLSLSLSLSSLSLSLPLSSLCSFICYFLLNLLCSSFEILKGLQLRRTSRTYHGWYQKMQFINAIYNINIIYSSNHISPHAKQRNKFYFSIYIIYLFIFHKVKSSQLAWC